MISNDYRLPEGHNFIHPLADTIPHPDDPEGVKRRFVQPGAIYI